jgi:diguanylate cyclase (GGDEF)-like protein
MNEQLLQRIRQCPNLPSLPTIAVQVLDLAQKVDADIAEIARIISKDPALSGKILRTVNSSFYGRSQHVSTISHALVILGLQSVKTLVLGFSLVTNLSKTKANGFKHITYWRRSIYSATAARAIAAKINIVQQEEAFLAALLQDIGMLVLDQVLGESYGEIYSKTNAHTELVALEEQALGMSHAQVAGFLAESWKLPPLLSVPIAQHHSPNEASDPALRKLAEVVQISGRCADVFVDAEPAGAISDVRAACGKNYKMSDADADALLDDIGKRTKEVASLFEINIGSVVEYEAILKKANEALVEITLQSQMQASNLKKQNQELKIAVVTDALSGLANRKRFDEFLTDQLGKSVSGNKPLALLMIDIDKFKSINDTHGHPAGDMVIRTIGKLLKTAARPQDLAARYGGEEMALILPGTNRTVASAIAETLRRAISARAVQHANAQIDVTASVGVACFEPGSPLNQPSHLIKAADMALYNAKHSGRNCVKVFAMKAAGKAA